MDLDIDPAELYHENSKLTRSDDDLYAWFGFVATAPALQQTLSQPYKRYRGKPRVPLPDPPAAVLGFDEALLARRSERSFAGAVELGELGKMLHFGYGLSRRDRADLGPVERRFRAAPSAGGLFPLEVYVAARDVTGLDAGVYHYAPAEHALELLAPGDCAERLGDITFSPDVLRGAAGAVILSGFFPRSAFKYRKRAYRFVLLEAGHVCQNLMLTACSLGLGTVALGGFVDDELNDLLGIDGLDEAALYVIPFGRPGAPPAHGG
jgi:SagB-type dehydrogenase family enzyme